MEQICIRPMEENQVAEVSALIGRVLLEVNIRDYPREALMEFVEYYNPEGVAAIPKSGGHSYVAMLGDELLACGSVAPMEDGRGSARSGPCLYGLTGKARVWAENWCRPWRLTRCSGLPSVWRFPLL